MKISTIKIISLVFLLGVSRLSIAQTQEELIANYVTNVTSDFNTYMDAYMDPLLKGLGYGFNNGWYNTARPHKSFGFDLTISVNAAYVPTIDQSFKFNPDDYKAVDLYFDDTDPIKYGNQLPTIMGGTTETELSSYLVKGNPISPHVDFPVLDGIRDDLPVNSVAVPSPIIQLGVGIFKGTEVKVRWVPTIEGIEGLNYKYFGLGVMHNVSQWVPVLKNMKFLDVSAFVGYTGIDLAFKLDSDPDTNPLDDQVGVFGVNTITYEVVGSATFSVLTGFVGIGFDNFKTNLGMNGTYEFKVPVPDPNIEIKERVENPVNLEAKHSGFRATVGARLKLAILTLHGAYTFQEYNTLNVGLGFSFR